MLLRIQYNYCAKTSQSKPKRAFFGLCSLGDRAGASEGVQRTFEETLSCSVGCQNVPRSFSCLRRRWDTRSLALSPYLTIDGEVTTPLTLSQVDFQAFPHTSITVTEGSGQKTIYSGVDLSVLLLKAGVPLKQNLKGADVAKYLHVQGADGFVEIFSLPEFDQTTFLVADMANDSPLPTGTGPLQVISPNETRHSRWVKQLTLLRIEKSATE